MNDIQRHLWIASNTRTKLVAIFKTTEQGRESVNKPLTDRGERQSGGRELVELSARTLRDGWLHGLRALADGMIVIGCDLDELPPCIHLEIKGRTFSPQGSTGSGVASTVVPGQVWADFQRRRYGTSGGQSGAWMLGG